MTTHDPHAKYLEQPWHTVETLRELAREQDALITQLYAERGTMEYIALIERTPQAFRIFGAISHYLTNGYDADHLIAWLDRGAVAGVEAAWSKKITVEALRQTARAQKAEDALGKLRAFCIHALTDIRSVAAAHSHIVARVDAALAIVRKP